MLLAFTGVVFLVWVIWWLSSRSRREQEVAPIEIDAQPPEPVVEAPSADVQAGVGDRAAEIELEIEPESGPALGGQEPPAVPDDLKRIEGIGPKLSMVLQEAGIVTFALLAAASPDRLAQILEAADPRLLRLADPATWPEQAALAAAGEWDALAVLQGTLKGGRRV
jgi:predicted flap endonuclease-1-like 5' DNA nuclease